jgi:hypothetical protein
MVESTVAYRVLALKTEGDLLEDRGVDVVIILKWMLEKWDAGHGLDRSCSGYGQVVGFCESGDERSGSIKCGEFLE